MIVMTTAVSDYSPRNLHVSLTTTGGPSREERVERKFFVAPGRALSALALLRRSCRWDRDFPREQVNSLYFDTADLDQHDRSIAGEYAKDKVRIRWYGADPVDGGPVPVWLELKSRRGFMSSKQRLRLEVPGSRLDHDHLSGGIVSATRLLETMAGFGFFAPGPLLPVLVVRYFRYRFVEPRSGYRVSLDTNVRSSLVFPGLGRRERSLRLLGSVIEVKGPSVDMPAALLPVADLGSSWTRFSKYSSSIDAHVSRLGTVARLWPPGMCRVES
jgi:hypothetical protein